MENLKVLDEFFEMKDKSLVKSFISDKDNQKKLLREILFSLTKLKIEKVQLKAVKKLIDMNLDIDTFDTKDDIEIFHFIDDFINDKNHTKELLSDIIISLIQLKIKNINIQGIKELIDNHLSIDDFYTKENRQLYRMIDNILNNKKLSELE